MLLARLHADLHRECEWDVTENIMLERRTYVVEVLFLMARVLTSPVFADVGQRCLLTWSSMMCFSRSYPRSYCMSLCCYTARIKMFDGQESLVDLMVAL